MTELFPKHEAFMDGHKPSRVEADVFDLEVEGEIPSGLGGSWCRLGPDTQYPPFIADDIWINGDGYMSMFRFENGHVDMKSRYVRTERFITERAARRALFGRYRNGHTDDPIVRGKNRTTANTTPVWHAGHLLATKEDGRPYELDPVTLETKGEYSWDGKLRSKTVTAHAKHDHATGELLFFGYEANGDGSSEVAFCVADKHGRLTREEWFDPPYVSMIHDFAITQDYVIFPIFPTTMDPQRLRAGGSHWAWDGSKETMVGIMPRGGSVKDMRWFRKPACHAYHVINSYNEGAKVHVDLVQSQINTFHFIPDITGAPWDPRKATMLPTRWTFDMSNNAEGFEERMIGPPSELPRVDDRLIGQDYRYYYLMTMTPPSGSGQVPGPTTISRVDLKDRKLQSWADPGKGSYQEPQFVPSGDDEAAGHLLTMVDYPDQGRCELQIFDAERIKEGPMAKVHVPLHMRRSIHTAWIASSGSTNAIT
jgi:carotenoid cleavage dioxygenase-like enzyme